MEDKDITQRKIEKATQPNEAATPGGRPKPLTGRSLATEPVVVKRAGVPLREYPEIAIPAKEELAEDEMRLICIGDGTRYAGPPTPTSLDAVGMTAQVDGLLTPEARAKLAEQGFVVVPERFRLFHHAYDEQYYEGTPVFLTTDAAYNAWHLVFDKTLRDIETRKLSPALASRLGTGADTRI